MSLEQILQAGPDFDFRQALDSPIEHQFAWHLVKYLNPAIQLRSQVWVNLPAANYRVDFMATDLAGQRFVFECDGKDWHGRRKDLIRDERIILGGKADVIWRIRGTDIVHAINDALAVIAHIDRSLFDERGHRLLTILRARSLMDRLEQSRDEISACYPIDCPEDPDVPEWRELVLTRRS